jgi:hypothetical protein
MKQRFTFAEFALAALVCVISWSCMIWFYVVAMEKVGAL